MESDLEKSNSMEDIQNLLHLEALKRYTEEAKDLQRQVEDTARTFFDAKSEYRTQYTRIVNLSKQFMLSRALQAKHMNITDAHVKHTSADLSKSQSIITNDVRPVELNLVTLEECRAQLETKHKPRQQLASHQANYAENCDTLRAISGLLDHVENTFEAVTLAGMDQFTGEMQPQESDL